jgi:uracil-DNA glycosylase family 4
MSFLPSTSRSRLVPGVGRDNAKIVIVGDYTTPFDDKALKPFTGPNGSVLESCLHGAGLIKGNVYITNTFKSVTKRYGKTANTDFFDEEKKKFTELGLEHAEMLRREIEAIQPNVIVAAGNPALMALTGLSSVAKYRGYVCMTSKLRTPTKLIPTYSPGSTLRGTYTNRHMIVSDLRKAKQESEFPELVRPDRHLIYDHKTVEECLQWLDYYVSQPRVCFDIEVINYEVSCVSFASTPDVGCVIPIGDSEFKPQGWIEDEELQLWRGIQRVLGNPNTTKIVQNGMFDIHFLATRCGVMVRGPIHDTMIAHSVMFPELPKGLDFLGSIYCGAQEYWKDAVKFNNIKGES